MFGGNNQSFAIADRYAYYRFDKLTLTGFLENTHKVHGGLLNVLDFLGLGLHQVHRKASFAECPLKRAVGAGNGIKVPLTQ